MRARLLNGSSPIPRVGVPSGGGALPIGAIQYYPANPGAGFLKAEGLPFSPLTYPALAAATPRVLGFKRGFTGVNVGYPVTGVAYGNGVWVTVADQSNVLYSDDGVNWTYSGLPTGGVNCVAVTFGAGLFVLIALDTYCFTSPDGKNWTYRPLPDPTRQNRGICYGNGQYVMCQAGGWFRTSTDGLNWTSRYSNLSTVVINAVKYINGMYVAVTGNGGSSFIWTSTDAITWTARVSPASNEIFKDVVFGGGLYVVAGANLARLYYSTDLSSWTSVSPGSGYYINALSYGDGLFVIADQVQVLTTPDLVNFTSQQANIGGGAKSCMATCFANNRHVAGVVQDTCVFSMYSTPVIAQGTLANGQPAIPYMKAA